MAPPSFLHFLCLFRSDAVSESISILNLNTESQSRLLLGFSAVLEAVDAVCLREGGQIEGVGY